MATVILYPNGAGTYTEWGDPGTPHWQAVDEAVADDDTTFVSDNTWLGVERDSYTIAATGLPTSGIAITKITVTIRARYSDASGSGTTLKHFIRASGIDDEGPAFALSAAAAYGNFNREWATNPATGGAWTPSQISALEIGMRNAMPTGVTWGVRVTQVFVTVQYNIVPEGHGKLLATVYAAGGAGTYVATLPTILSAWVKRAVGQIGSFEITVPAIDAALASATQGREIVITREEDGDIFRGVIMGKRYGIDAQERYVAILTGLSLAVELHWQSTYMGVVIDAQTSAAAADLVLSGSGWTDLQTGAGFVSMSDRYDNMSLWQAMERLTETQGAYLRETTTARQVEIKRGTTASGVRLLSPEYVTPEMGSNPLIGFIESITSYEDGAGIVNRIVPFGHDADNIVFDLRYATRASPYAIQVLNQNIPSISGPVINGQWIEQTPVNTDGSKMVEYSQELTTLEMSGSNRAVLAFVRINNSGSGQIRNIGIEAGGRLGALIVSVGSTSLPMTRAYLVKNVPSGEVTIKATYQVQESATGPHTFNFDIVAIPLQDVDQLTAVNSTSASGSGTAPSLTLAEVATSIRFAAVTSTTAYSATSAAGQDNIRNTLSANVLTVDSKTGGTDTLAWTFAASESWHAVAVQLAGPKLYYLEDAASVTAYGRRVEMMIEEASKLVGATSTQLEASTNTLYDLASTRLARIKDPVTFYEVRASYLGSISWLVGDSIRVDYQGFTDAGVWLSVNTDLIVMERTENFGEDGVRRWELVLATQYRDPPSDSDLFAQQVERIMALEGAR